MQNSHHYIYHFLHNELNEIYVSMAIRAVAISMISIFVPLLLLQLGYSLVTVLLFHALMGFCQAILVPFAGKIAARFGFKKIIFMSAPFLIAYYLGILLLAQIIIPLWILALVGGLQKAMFWTGYHTNMAHVTKKEKTGKELSMITIISFVAKIIGPALGGYLLSIAPYWITVIIVCVLLLLSTTPLFFTSETVKTTSVSIKEIFRSRKFKHAVGLMGVGIEAAASLVVWPLIIYLTITEKFTLIGIFTSASVVVAIFITIIIGRMSDTFPKKHMIRAGGFFNAIVWFIRSLVITPLGVFVADSVGSLTKTLWHLPVNAHCYEIAKREENISRFILFREFAINIGFALVLFALAFIWQSVAGTTTGIVGSLAVIVF